MTRSPSFRPSRRHFLSSTGMTLLAASIGGAKAAEHAGKLPWKPFAALPPQTLPGGRWYVFTPAEVRLVEAIVDRLIPADELSIGGKDAGCASFIDRQLAGSYGTSDRLYTQGPFLPGLPTQGFQGRDAPAARYRAGLAAIDAHVRSQFAGKVFADLQPADQDKVLQDFEAGKVGYAAAAGFFNLLLQNTMEGFFADPIYGGNMSTWLDGRFIGFPGARYDYRDLRRETQSTLSACRPVVDHAGRAGMDDQVKRGTIDMAKQASPSSDVVIVGLGWTVCDPCAATDRCRPRCRRHRTRAVARHGDRFQHRLYARRTALCDPARICFFEPAQESVHVPQQRRLADGAADPRITVRSCRAMASVARACTGTAIRGASFPRDFNLKSASRSSDTAPTSRISRL